MRRRRRHVWIKKWSPQVFSLFSPFALHESQRESNLLLFCERRTRGENFLRVRVSSLFQALFYKA